MQLKEQFTMNMIFTGSDFIYLSSFFVILKYSIIYFFFVHVTEISCRPMEESQKIFLNDMIVIDTKLGLPVEDNNYNIAKDYTETADSNDEKEFDLTQEYFEFDGLIVSNFKRRRLDKWPRHNLTYRVTKYTSQLSKAVVDNQIKKAFEIWSEVTQLTFTKKLSGHVDIEIRFDKGDHGDCCPHDGRAHNVAHAFSPSDKASLGGDIHIDDDEDWTNNLDELMLVVAHEAGHSLGLRHSEKRSSIMFRSYQHKKSISLDEEDITNIQKLYGLPQNKSKNKQIWHANLVNNSKHSKHSHRKQKMKHPQKRGLRSRLKDENQFFSASRFKSIHENNLNLQIKPRIKFIVVQYEPTFLEVPPANTVIIPHEYNYISPYKNKSPDIVIPEEELIEEPGIQDNNIRYRAELLFEGNSEQKSYEIFPANVNQRSSPFGGIILEDDSIPITKIISEEEILDEVHLG